MPAPTPDELWQALVRTRLLEAGVARQLRAEHAALPAAAARDGSATAIAGWLLERGVITRWQAKRLLVGEAGPFFLGDFRLLERRERSGDTLVFAGRHDPSGRAVTLMLLNAKRCRDPGVLDTIASRVAIAARARHPLLVGMWSLEQVDAARFVVCEPVGGETLAAEVARLGTLPPREAAIVARQVAEAVAELHALGGVHGGLSLDALIREPSPAAGGPRSGRVRLLQFPLVDEPRSDVHAIGTILQGLLVGHAPGCGGDRGQSPAAATGNSAPPPPAVPRPLAEVMERMLASDPEQRFRDPREAAAALARWEGEIDPGPAGIDAIRPGDNPVAEASAFDFGPAPSPRGRRGRRRTTAWLPWAGIVVTAVLAAVAAGVAMSQRRERVGVRPVATRPRPVAGSQPPAAGPNPVAQPAGEAVAPPPNRDGSARVSVVDDPSLPWVSPTSGSPPTLSYLLPGAEAVLLVRLAEVAADGEGSLFLRSLGPEVESALNRLVTLSGGDVAAIESVQAAWSTVGGDAIVGACAVRFAAGRTAPADAAAREVAWGPTTTREIADETVFEAGGVSLWSPRAEQGRVLVIAPMDVPADGETSPMERLVREVGPLAVDESLAVRAVVPASLETLVGMLDADRHVTLLVSPQSLLRTGRKLLAGPLALLAEPLDAICGESIEAAGLSLHFNDPCYVELDAVPASDVTAKRLADDLAGRIAGLGDRIAAEPAALDPDPYGRTIVLRLPAMLRIVAERMRRGAEGRGAVLNAYLPRHAPHNIALAAELTLAQAAGRPNAATRVPSPAGASTRASAALGKRLTLSFASDTLERSLQVLADETGVPIEILGGDLQAEGITKNQSFALDERDKTAEEILRVILAKSNAEGKLVYVVREQDGVERVIITTRAAAEARGDQLPPAFAADAAH